MTFLEDKASGLETTPQFVDVVKKLFEYLSASSKSVAYASMPVGHCRS
jgi:hypothetical protein